MQVKTDMEVQESGVGKSNVDELEVRSKWEFYFYVSFFGTGVPRTQVLVHGEEESFLKIKLVFSFLKCKLAKRIVNIVK